MAVNRYAALFEHLAKELRGKARRVFNRNCLARSGIVERNVSPERNLVSAGLASDVQSARTSAGRRRDHTIIDLIVSRVGRDVEEGFFAGVIARLNVHEYYVVVDGQGGNGRAPFPDQIILRPAFAVALEGVVGVVPNDVTIDIANALLHHFIGKLLEDLQRRLLALSARVVWQRASADVGITATDQKQVTFEAAMLVDGSRGFYRGVELILGPDQCQRGSRGEKFGVGGGRKKFIGVEAVERLTGRERDDFNTPEAARDVRLVEDAADLGRKRFCRFFVSGK